MTLRRLRHVAGFVLAMLLILAGSALFHYRSATCAQTVRLHFIGFTSKEDDQIKVLFLSNRDGLLVMPRLAGQATSYWFAEDVWIRTVLLEMPAEQLPRLNLVVTIGEREHAFSGRDIQPRNHVSGEDSLVTVPLDVVESSVPWTGPGYVNWPGDAAFLHVVWQTALLPSLLVLLFGFFMCRRASPAGTAWCRQLLGLEHDLPRQATSRFWNWAGIIFLGGMLAFLEIREPYYFTQSDNLFECLPRILAGCRDIWLGEFPEYDPYIQLGGPLVSLGIYSLTYLPTLLSYALALHVLGQEYATVEVFCILHIVAGYYAIRVLGRNLGLGGFTGNLVSVSCVLSGSALIMGRSWFNFVPVFTWLPLLFLGLLRLGNAASPTWRWVVAMGLAIGLPCHLGFPQLSLYLTAFVCLGAVYLTAVRAIPVRRLLLFLAAILVGIGLAVPLMYQQWLFARQVGRDVVPSVNQGIALSLPALLLPYPLVQAELPPRFGNKDVQYMGQIYFFGGLLAFLFFFQLVGLAVFRPHGQQWTGQLWTFCALVALVLALGNRAGLWQLLTMVPVIGPVNRHPFRLLPFFVFFASLSGGLVLERFLANWRAHPHSAGAGRLTLLVAVPAALLLALHVYQSRTAMHVAGFRPYPDMPAALKAYLWQNGQPTGRVCSWGKYSHNDTYALQMAQNMGDVYQLPTDLGVCPLVNGHELVKHERSRLVGIPEEAMKAYGDRWHLIQDEQHLTPDSSVLASTWQTEVRPREDSFRRHFAFASFRFVDNIDGVIVAELEGVDPLAFPEKNRGQSLPLRMHGLGIDVDVSSLAGDEIVVVNFLNYPHMRAFVDGEPVLNNGVARCFSDEWKRIMVRVSAGARSLEVRYRPPWSTGLWLGAATTACGLVLTWYCQRRRPTNPMNEA